MRLSLLADDMILCIENHKEYTDAHTHMWLKLINSAKLQSTGSTQSN